MAYKRKDRWTAAQIQFILENYRTMKDNEMAFILGRSLKSVRHKRIRLSAEKASNGKGTFGLPGVAAESPPE